MASPFPRLANEYGQYSARQEFPCGYINTNDLYGHPIAMQIWNRFYDFPVKRHGLAEKVALKVSRGGLYVYGRAKRNLEKASCIYAEAPVTDPMS